MQSLKDHGYVPCLSAKFTYKRGPNRRKHPLDKLSADLCSINQEIATGDKMSMLVVNEATRYKWCYLLMQKNEAVALTKELILQLSN